MAEGSPRQLIEQHSTREVLELRFGDETLDDAWPDKLAGIGERIEVLPDRILLYADDGDAAAARGARSAGSRRRACWCGAARWRTCSCG